MRNPVRNIVPAVCVLSALLAFALPASADDDAAAQMEAISKAAKLIAPEQAVERAVTAKPGTVLDIDLDRKFQGYYYEVELIDAAGIEWEVEIDASSGEVRRVKRDWFD
jgi:uncharacterized membrane protein YkoI